MLGEYMLPKGALFWQMIMHVFMIIMFIMTVKNYSLYVSSVPSMEIKGLYFIIQKL